jgi:asparagine synthase (glutamine-hydrolysing)
MEVPRALADSVAAHLVSDVPVGVLLSGGVDSTLIASLAAERVPDLQSFSLVNPAAPHIDEASYAAWNAQLLGTRHHEVPFDPSSAMTLTRELIATSGEPFGDAAYLPLATLCCEVRRHVKVVLAGEGADELFAGYRRYDVERPRQGGITAPLAGIAGRIAGGRRRYDRGAPSMRTRTLASWAAADPYLAHSYLLSGEWPVVAASPRGAEALRLHRARWGNLVRQGLPAYRAYDLCEWLPNVFLEKSDRASMLASVEVRVPFLDPVVAASARGLDLRDSRKRPLRDLLQQRHPAVRLPPRKMGLSVDLPALLARSGLGAFAESALHDDGSVLNLDGMPDRSELARRARANAALAFRLATVGVWQDVMAPRVG